jgi:hypothetical protein
MEKLRGESFGFMAWTKRRHNRVRLHTRHGLRASLSDGCKKQAFLGCVISGEFSSNTAIMEHENTVAHPHQFGELARNKNHGFSAPGETVNDVVDL